MNRMWSFYIKPLKHPNSTLKSDNYNYFQEWLQTWIYRYIQDFLFMMKMSRDLFLCRTGFVSYFPQFIKAGLTFIHSLPVIIQLSHGHWSWLQRPEINNPDDKRHLRGIMGGKLWSEIIGWWWGVMVLNLSLTPPLPPPPLDVFIGAQQREFNLPYLSRTPLFFQRGIREKGEDNCSLFYLI